MILEIKVFCKVSSLFSISCISWKMFPKVVLFQRFRCILKFLSRCWNLYMQVPCSISSWLHQEVVKRWNSGWECKNFSNLSGLSFGIDPASKKSEMVQWSKSALGRMLASMVGSSTSRASIMRKRFSWKETYWCPDLWLDQVKIPFCISISIRFS